MKLQKQIDYIREVIENEHGGEVYDGEDYFTPDWDAMKSHIGYAILKAEKQQKLNKIKGLLYE